MCRDNLRRNRWSGFERRLEPYILRMIMMRIEQANHKDGCAQLNVNS